MTTPTASRPTETPGKLVECTNVDIVLIYGCPDDTHDAVIPHDCNEKCVSMEMEREAPPPTADVSPLAVPLELGWQR